MKKFLTHPATLVTLSLIAGAAIGDRIPVINTVAANVRARVINA